MINKTVKHLNETGASDGGTFKDEFITKCDEQFREHLHTEPTGDELTDKYVRGTVKMLGLLYLEGIVSETLIKRSANMLLIGQRESQTLCHRKYLSFAADHCP